MMHFLLITFTMLLLPFQLSAATSLELLTSHEVCKAQHDNCPLFSVQYLQFSPVSVKNGQLQWKPSKRDVSIPLEYPQVLQSGCTLCYQLNSTTDDIPYQVVDEKMNVMSIGVFTNQSTVQRIHLDELQPGTYYLLLMVGDDFYAAQFILSK